MHLTRQSVCVANVVDGDSDGDAGTIIAPLS